MIAVAPREGRVSRNRAEFPQILRWAVVAPREGRVSRNVLQYMDRHEVHVAPREGRVSRN